MVIQCLTLFQQLHSNGSILKSLTWINMLAIVQKNVDLGYSEELRELHNDYPLAPDKIEIKRKMLS